MGSWRIVIGYADSSFIVSLYATDANSEAAASASGAARMPLAWTEWHSLEVGNALRLREFRRLATDSETDEVLAAIHKDLDAGMLSRAAVDLSRSLARSRELSEKHSAAIGTRSLDILHVAIALELQASEFPFDQRQSELWHLASGRKALPQQTLSGT